MASLIILIGFWSPFAVHSGEHRHHDAHSHGEGKVQLVVEGSQIQVELTLPGEDTVGFESAALSKKQKAKLKTTLDFLQSPKALRPTGGDCAVKSAEGKWAGTGKHREIRVRYQFECKKVAEWKGLEFGLKKKFPKIGHLELTAILPEGQKKQEVESSEWNRK